MNGSNGNVVSLLEKIVERLETLERIDKAVGGLREDVRHLRQDRVKGFGQVNARIDQTNGRLDNLLVFTGKSHAELAERVTALERKVFKKSG